MEFWNSALGQRWHLAIQRLAEVTSSSVYLCRYGGKLARYSIKIWVFWGIKWWYKQRWSLKMITINIKRYDNWLLPECVWYGEVLCDGAVIIVSLKKKRKDFNSKNYSKDGFQYHFAGSPSLVVWVALFEQENDRESKKLGGSC